MNNTLDKHIKNFRAIFSDDIVKVYNEKTRVEIANAISFDSENKELTSIDLFVTSVVSEIILNMKKQAIFNSEILQDVEAKASCTIKNPLSLLNVIGCEDRAEIERLKIEIYFYSFMENDTLDTFLDTVKEHSIIYNSVKDIIELDFKQIL